MIRPRLQPVRRTRRDAGPLHGSFGLAGRQSSPPGSCASSSLLSRREAPTRRRASIRPPAWRPRRSSDEDQVPSARRRSASGSRRLPLGRLLDRVSSATYRAPDVIFGVPESRLATMRVGAARASRRAPTGEAAPVPRQAAPWRRRPTPAEEPWQPDLDDARFAIGRRFRGPIGPGPGQVVRPIIHRGTAFTNDVLTGVTPATM